MPIVNFKLDTPFFDDLTYEERSRDDLTLLILRDANQEDVSLVNYSRSEIERCARKLIIEGYLRGTVLDFTSCVWSRLTSKGRYLLFLMGNDESVNYF